MLNICNPTAHIKTSTSNFRSVIFWQIFIFTSCTSLYVIPPLYWSFVSLSPCRSGSFYDGYSSKDHSHTTMPFVIQFILSFIVPFKSPCGLDPSYDSHSSRDPWLPPFHTWTSSPPQDCDPGNGLFILQSVVKTKKNPNVQSGSHLLAVIHFAFFAVLSFCW